MLFCPLVGAGLQPVDAASCLTGEGRWRRGCVLLRATSPTVRPDASGRTEVHLGSAFFPIEIRVHPVVLRGADCGLCIPIAAVVDSSLARAAGRWCVTKSGFGRHVSVEVVL